MKRREPEGWGQHLSETACNIRMKNKRLEKILEYLPSCRVVADIGTDHGYVPVEAVRSGRSQRAIAADISRGSLEKAIAQIRMQGMEAVIDARWGSGLKVLKEDEADVIVIAGMGGELIAEILESDYERKFRRKTPLLILQPVQFPAKLRAYLHRKGFLIVQEDLVKDEGIIYHLIMARKTEKSEGNLPSEPELELGKINLEKDTPLLQELIDSKIKACDTLIAELEGKEGERVRVRLEEVKAKKEEYRMLGSREA